MTVSKYRWVRRCARFDNYVYVYVVADDVAFSLLQIDVERHDKRSSLDRDLKTMPSAV